jgi:hypothetical protein
LNSHCWAHSDKKAEGKSQGNFPGPAPDLNKPFIEPAKKFAQVALLVYANPPIGARCIGHGFISANSIIRLDVLDARDVCHNLKRNSSSFFIPLLNPLIRAVEPAPQPMTDVLAKFFMGSMLAPLVAVV